MLYNARLTYLHLHSMHPENRVSLEDLIHILQNQPTLANLRIELGSSTLEMAQMPLLDLPNLQKIQLYGTAKSCLGLMASISYPNHSTKVKLCLKAGPETDFQNFIMPFLFRHYTSGTPATIFLLVDQRGSF